MIGEDVECECLFVCLFYLFVWFSIWNMLLIFVFVIACLFCLFCFAVFVGARVFALVSPLIVVLRVGSHFACDDRFCDVHANGCCRRLFWWHCRMTTVCEWFDPSFSNGKLRQEMNVAWFCRYVASRTFPTLEFGLCEHAIGINNPRLIELSNLFFRQFLVLMFSISDVTQFLKQSIVEFCTFCSYNAWKVIFILSFSNQLLLPKCRHKQGVDNKPYS